MRTAIIMSSAVVEPELAVELGPVPASYVPVGNRRLLHHQLEALRPVADRIVLTLSRDRRSAAWDDAELGHAGVEIVELPPGLSLGNALLAAVLQSDAQHDELIVLHGDTLFGDLAELPQDGLFAHHSDSPYLWAHVTTDTEGEVWLAERNSADVEVHAESPLVASGAFVFADALRLLQALAAEQGRFVPAVNRYASGRGEFEVVTPATPWWDFGHVGNYHQSRRHWLATRHFNHLRFEGHVVRKEGDDPAKLDREARWFERLPADVLVHAPRYLGRTARGGYALGYEHLSPLSDLYVQGDLSGVQWHRAMGAVADYIDVLRRNGGSESEATASFRALVVDKSQARLPQIQSALGLVDGAPILHRGRDLPPLPDLVGQVVEAVMDEHRPRPALMHGDLCFSNMLYDQRTQRIIAIDPRGVDETGQLTGDAAYDLAKLWHSAEGHYDSFLAGRFRLVGSGDDERVELYRPRSEKVVADLFRRMVLADDPQLARLLRQLGTLLFLTMVPLHGEDPARQRAFYRHALDLHLGKS